MLTKTGVLSEILQSIQKLYDSVNNISMYRDILNTIQFTEEERLQNGACTAFAADFGIGSLVFKACQVGLTATDPLSVLFVDKHHLQSTQNLKSYWHVRDLKPILEKCRIISFADWASIDGASDLWDHLRTEVIKPLGRHDYEFIFYLGDTSNKPPYEVDEILDIMSAFSFSGKVTLILRDGETSELWKQQKGNASLSFVTDNDSKGQYIFNSMNIDRLLVYSPDHRITIFSGKGREEWVDRALHIPNVNGIGREHFNIGYILGLLLQLGTIHCTALGLALSGAYLRNEVILDLNTLQTYIQNWIHEMDQPFAKK
jgi:hypothetical protein